MPLQPCECVSDRNKISQKIGAQDGKKGGVRQKKAELPPWFTKTQAALLLRGCAEIDIQDWGLLLVAIFYLTVTTANRVYRLGLAWPAQSVSPSSRGGGGGVFNTHACYFFLFSSFNFIPALAGFALFLFFSIFLFPQVPPPSSTPNE